MVPCRFHPHFILTDLGVMPLIGGGKGYVEGGQVICVECVSDLKNMDHDCPHIICGVLDLHHQLLIPK